eukprot:10000505-Lingulodinium_polyedra.AAC.1
MAVPRREAGLRLLWQPSGEKLLVNPATAEVAVVQREATLHFGADGWAWLRTTIDGELRDDWVNQSNLLQKVAVKA